MGRNTKWQGNSLYYLLTLPKDKRYIVFCDLLGYSRANIEVIRRLKLKQIKEGKTAMPETPRNYEKGQSPEQVARQIDHRRVGEMALSSEIDAETRQYFHDQLDKALDQVTDPGSIGSIKIQTGEHTGYIKNTDGEIEYTEPLKRKGISFTIEADRREPLWEPVKRIESVKLPKREKAKRPGETNKAVILSDLQFPYADEQAVDVALQIVRDVKPDKVILVGDMLDLASWGKYEQRPEFAAQTQESIIQAHQLLATLRKICPSADIAVLEGNHDIRMQKAILNNAMQAYGIKRADQLDHWPVMSVPYLTAMDTLDVEYVAGYPANRYWINDNLQVRHGQKVRSSGSTAKLVNDDERVSTIFGHTHRLEVHHKTVQVRDGARISAAYSIGCLCKIDGSVPSAKGGHDLKGKPVENYENWQNAIAVVDYEEGEGSFNVNPIFINTTDNYKATHNGRVYHGKTVQP